MLPSFRHHRAGNRLPAASVALLLALLVSACGKPPAGPPPRGTPAVTVVTVTPADVPVVFEFVAQTQSSRQVNIQARVSGFLDKRVYTEGSMVKEGQVLFLMDKKPFQAQLDQSKAALQQQQAVLDNSRSNLERTKPLVAQNALSQKDLDDATGQYQQSAAAVAQAQAQVVQAQLNLSYCTITSPIDGISKTASSSPLSPRNTPSRARSMRIQMIQAAPRIARHPRAEMAMAQHCLSGRGVWTRSAPAGRVPQPGTWPAPS